MRESILSVLERGEQIISDGALGTMLQALGLPAGMLPELWNVENPQAVQSVHRAYLQAGSQSITANTFGANRARLSDAGLGHRHDELNRLGIALAKEVAGDSAWVAASIGPTGQLMEPFGALSIEEAEELYAAQIRVVAEAGADVILLETHHDLEEASCVARMAKAHTDLPVFCAFAFNAKGRTMMGLRPEVAATRMAEIGVDAVGANCGDGPAAIVAALGKMREATDLPLIAQANAGIPQIGQDAQTLWDVTPAQMTEHVRAFVALGARILGGCCGTGPEHISAIVAAICG